MEERAVMEERIEVRNEFLQKYWSYYLMLEKNFIEIEQYLTIDELNFNAFSNEYIKQYQTICSEIDVIVKAYCKEIDNHFKGCRINDYCQCIIAKESDFSHRKVKLVNKGIEIIPWENWTYSIETQEDGKEKTIFKNPDWWIKYNKIKHNRTTIDKKTGYPYYKLANQKNVLYSLAALFQLEMYYYRLLWKNYFQSSPDMPYPLSELFEIENWGNRWMMLGNNLGFEMIDLGE